MRAPSTVSVNLTPSATFSTAASNPADLKLIPAHVYDITANGDVRTLSRLSDLIIEDRRVNGKKNFFGWKINGIFQQQAR